MQIQVLYKSALFLLLSAKDVQSLRVPFRSCLRIDYMYILPILLLHMMPLFGFPLRNHVQVCLSELFCTLYKSDHPYKLLLLLVYVQPYPVLLLYEIIPFHNLLLYSRSLPHNFPFLYKLAPRDFLLLVLLADAATLQVLPSYVKVLPYSFLFCSKLLLHSDLLLYKLALRDFLLLVLLLRDPVHLLHFVSPM